MLPLKLADDQVWNLQKLSLQARLSLGKCQHAQIVEEGDEVFLGREAPDAKLPDQVALNLSFTQYLLDQSPPLRRLATSEAPDALQLAIVRTDVEVQHLGREPALLLELAQKIEDHVRIEHARIGRGRE